MRTRRGQEGRRARGQEGNSSCPPALLPSCPRFTAMQRLVSAWVWTAWVLIVLLGFPVACVIFAATAPFDPGRYAVGRWFRLLGKAAAAANPWWRIRVSGVRIDDPRRPYVAVANHESYADIMLLCYLPW